MKTVDMPKMGDTMEEGKILRWIKQEGDAVAKGEPVAEIETDKVNIEIEAFSSGVLRKILVSEGESAPIGASIAYIGAADEPLPGQADDNGSNGKAARGGSKKEKPAPASATSAAPVVASASVAVAPAPALTTNAGRIFISPLARRLAEEYNLDYRQVRGSGPNGRIIKLDVEAAVKQLLPVASAAPSTPVFTPEPALASLDTGEVVEIPLTTMRRTIARRLTQSMQSAPHFYVTSVIDTGKLGELRRQINAYAATDPNPVKVSFNDLIIKAVATTLVRFPQVNVSFAEDKLIQKKQVHIGVAVALEQGLIVPVLHNADRRGVLDVARESRRLTEASRTNKLRAEDLSGGTFTVSNLGMFDVDSFTAVINSPESAILAVGSITATPVVVDGQIVIRDRMKVTLSSDHRALDGAVAARFLQELKRLLEEPFGLLL
jgi:pyruvate dehydrogenase E2 component (dihydrolipoamide acetyltransferase)